jgi:hypothetical protein
MAQCLGCRAASCSGGQAKHTHMYLMQVPAPHLPAASSHAKRGSRRSHAHTTPHTPCGCRQNLCPW